MEDMDSTKVENKRLLNFRKQSQMRLDRKRGTRFFAGHIPVEKLCLDGAAAVDQERRLQQARGRQLWRC